MKRLLAIPLLLLTGCKDQKTSDKVFNSSTLPKYAKGFWVEAHEDYRDLFVRKSSDSSTAVAQYRLIEKDRSAPSAQGIVTIKVPISNIICTSTTHVPLLDYLQSSDKLIGFPTTKYISSTAMRKRIDEGKVKDLGVEGSLNVELLAQLQPSLVMTYSVSGDLGALKKAQELGIPVVINSEFLEHHPLGRAEWIKFMALFLGKEDKADSIFSWIENEYVEQQKVAASFSEHPTILTGIPYGGIWYLPGGKNYGAQFFRDAGCKYLWSDDPSSGFLQLSLETIFDRALDADYWIGVGSFETYDELKSADERFTKFAPFRNQKVFSYNNRIGPTGGNEYLELGYLRPDLILKDLIQITHPARYSNPNLFFYKSLR